MSDTTKNIEDCTKEELHSDVLALREINAALRADLEHREYQVKQADANFETLTGEYEKLRAELERSEAESTKLLDRLLPDCHCQETGMSPNEEHIATLRAEVDRLKGQILKAGPDWGKEVDRLIDENELLKATLGPTALEDAKTITTLRAALAKIDLHGDNWSSLVAHTALGGGADE